MIQVIYNILEKRLEHLRGKCITLMGIDMEISNPSKLRGSKASPGQMVLLGIVRLTVPIVCGIPSGICNLLQMKNLQLYEKSYVSKRKSDSKKRILWTKISGKRRSNGVNTVSFFLAKVQFSLRVGGWQWPGVVKMEHPSDKEVLPWPVEANLGDENDLSRDSYVTLKLCLWVGPEG